MADLWTQMLGVIISGFIYILIFVLGLPLAIYQAVSTFFPFVNMQITNILESSGYGRILLGIIKVSFLVNLLLVGLLFYFFTWYYLLPAF